MRTKAFIETHCKGRCRHFNRSWGCEAYDGEECDAVFCHPRWRGLSMRQRKAYYAYQKKPTPANEKEMHRQYRLLHKALTHLNYGYDPIAVAKDYIDAKFKNNKKGAK